MIISSCIYVVANGFLILFNVYVHHINNTIVYVHHIFIHSSVDRHLGCVHVLAVANRAAVNIGLFVSFQTMFVLWILVQEWDC